MLRHPLTHVRAGRYRTRTARAERSEGNQSPSGALISARFPTPRNVYQERCRQTIRPGGFFSWWRYRTRTAAEATAACGGNREPRLGPRSDFSKPCQGAAEKSANATRTGASHQIPSRFPTPRNVYQERCRQTIRSGDFFSWWMVQDENRNEQRQGIIVAMVSCLLF